MPRPVTARLPFDQFVEVTLASLLRALEARKVPHGPILIGIIYRPEEPVAKGGGRAGVVGRTRRK